MTFLPTTAEVLQDRALLSAVNLAQVDTSGFGAQIRDVVELQGKAFFLAGAPAAGSQNLWKSDGTSAGTEVVSDFPFGTLQHLTRVNDSLFFSLAHGNSQVAEGLWVSDGSTGGTTHVRTVGVNDAVNNDGVLLFAGNDHRGTELWSSDGTFEGTQLVRELMPGPAGSNVTGLQVFNQRVIFFARSESARLGKVVNGLWITDGTEERTELLKEVDSTDFRTAVATPLGIIFEVPDAGFGSELWISDGSREGTRSIGRLNSGQPWHAADFRSHDGRVFFRSNRVDGLWSTDGTADGTAAIRPDLEIHSLQVTSDGIYFIGSEAEHGTQVYFSDGTADGTVRVTAVPNDGNVDLFGEPLVTDGKRVYYFAKLDNTSVLDPPMAIVRVHRDADGEFRVDAVDDGPSTPSLRSLLKTSDGDRILDVFDGRFLFVDDDQEDREALWSADAGLPVSSTDNPLHFFHPRGRIREQYPEFSWNAVEGAVSYDLYVALAGSSEPSIHLSVATTKYASPDPLPPGRYTVWARPAYANGSVGAWQAQRFEMGKSPRVRLPDSSTDNSRPTITWDAISGADSYRVFVRNSTSRENVVDEIVNGTSFMPQADFELGRHRIWLAAIANGYQGAWSPVVSLDVAPAALQRRTATRDVRPTFQWSGVTAADKYELYVAGPNGFLVNEQSIEGTTYTVQRDMPAGTYRWWVRAADSDGRHGPWSQLNHLFTGGLTAAEVETHYSVNTPVLTWAEVPGAVSYEVYIAGRDASNNPSVYRQAGLRSNSFSPPPLTDSSEFWNYQVWIRTTLDDGTRQWGPSTSFDIYNVPEPLRQTTILGGRRTSFDGLPLFQWGRDRGDEGSVYDIYLYTPDEQKLFTGIEGAPVGETSEWTVPEPLRAYATDWKWYIRAVNSLGQAQKWRQGDDFHSGGRPRGESPFPTTTTQTQPVLTWTQTREATGYEVYVTNLSTGDRGFVQTQTQSNAYFMESPLAPGSYRYWVRAIAGSQISAWSLPYDFEVQ